MYPHVQLFGFLYLEAGNAGRHNGATPFASHRRHGIQQCLNSWPPVLQGGEICAEMTR